MELYPHNQKAVDAVNAHFASGNKKAAIVHATGTGKSYIIGAITERFKRAIIIAPNNFVLNETRKVCHKGCEFRTYASVMYNEGEHDNYDIIVLDEFHRSGAEKWGYGVQKLIEANPNALLFGTSATHIRYLDNQRNMADELFEGQVVSNLSLKDAIDRKILPNPTYVSSIYTMDDTVRIRKKKIFDSPRKDIDKDALCRRLDGIAHNWDNAGGVPAIIRKYFSHDMQRVIVFCSKVARAAEARKILSRWFGLAGFNRVRYYNIDYKEKRLEREMADFQQPLGDYDLKVAISVNMLNEGVHIPHVDGVIMLRSTISRIIIEQQVGRCLTSNNAAIIPVVLDLVNNMDMIRYDEPIFTGEFGPGNGNSRKEHKHKGFPFKVIDECRDMRILLNQLDKDMSLRKDFDTSLADLERFCEKEKRYPRRHSTNREESRIGYFCNSHLHDEKVMSVLGKYGIEKPVQKTIEQRIDELEAFCDSNNRLPFCHKSEEKSQYLFSLKHKNHPRIAALIDKYPREIHRKPDEIIQLLQAFCKTHNHLPKCNSSDNYERVLASWWSHHQKNETVAELINQYGLNSSTPETALNNFITFVNENERLPLSSKEDTLYNYMRRHNHLPEVKAMIDKYGYEANVRLSKEQFQIMISRLIAFCEEHGRNPFSSDKEHEIFMFMRNYRRNPEVKAVIQKYKKDKHELAMLRNNKI